MQLTGSSKAVDEGEKVSDDDFYVDDFESDNENDVNGAIIDEAT